MTAGKREKGFFLCTYHGMSFDGYQHLTVL